MAVIAPYAVARRRAMYDAIRDALADGGTMDRDGLYRVIPMVQTSTANRVIREMLASGQLVARRSAPGACNPLRYALTVAALDALPVPDRPTGVRVRLHDGGRYRIMTRPCAQHSQGRVLANMTWREALGVFTAPRADQTRIPLDRIESVYSSVASGFVVTAQCDRVPLTALPYTPPTTIGGAVVALLAEHGPLSVSEIAERLPQYRKTVIKSQMMRMGAEQTVMRVGGSTQEGRVVTTWTVGPVPLNGRQSRGRPSEVDTWTPEPWIHPIRRRLLGLPVASAEFDVPLDFSHPLRRAA
jgi:hypothetical protein